MDAIISTRGAARRLTLLLFSGMFVLQAGPVCAAPLSLAASLESPVCAEGQPVLLDLALHNDSPNSLFIGLSAWEASSFKIKVRDAAGRPVSPTAFGDSVLTPPSAALANGPVLLGPGQTFQYRYNLARMFDLSRTGEYQVTVSRSLVPRFSMWRPRAGDAQPPIAELTAGPLNVQITEERSLMSGPEPVTTPRPRATFLYVSNNDSPPRQPGDTVYRLQIGSSGRAVPTLGVPAFAGKGAMGVATTPDGHFLYTVNGEDNTVSQFRIGDEGRLSALTPPTVSCTQYPHFLLMDPRGRFLYAMSNWGNTLYAIGRDGRLSATLTIPAASWRFDPHRVIPVDAAVIDPTGSHLYACSGQTFCYHLGPDGRVTTVALVSAAAGAENIAIALSPSGRFAFVGCSQIKNRALFDEIVPMRVEADGTLSRLPGTQPIRGPGGWPYNDAMTLAVDPSGRFLLALVGNSVACYRIDTSRDATLSPIGVTRVSAEPIALLFGPVKHVLYTLDTHHNSVSTFRMDDLGALKQIGPPASGGNSLPGGMAIAAAPTPQKCGPTAGGIQMSAQLTHEVFPVDTPVVLTLRLRNITRRPVSLGPAGADMASLRLSFLGERAQLLLSAGRDPLNTSGSSAAPLILRPGGERQYRLVLSRLLDLSLSGDYTIRVSRTLPGGGTVAPPVRFQLREPPQILPSPGGSWLEIL